jgi:uncharacterized protein YodC (DUF2158 family)
MTFKAGDIVEVKSGGPPMTVESVGAQTVTCVRMEVSEEGGSYSVRDEFVVDTLVRVVKEAA